MKSLKAALVAFVVLGLSGAGCATSETTFSDVSDAGDAGGGSCDSRYCPGGCCVTANGPCGVLSAGSCVTPTPDAGNL
ncbi:MAG: hypothetical protein FJ104_10665 [Deltaproteobacteria bacterium]|nr:hypothetical protein [Deltaproteobacteria bacterium]